MLKINLLPPYINQAARIRSAWITMVAVLVAGLCVASYLQHNLVDQEKQMADQVQTDEQQVVQVQKLARDAQAELDKIKPIKDKTDFINQLLDFNKVRPDLYEHVASYIYKEVWVNGMTADQNTLTMPAQANSISAVGRFLLFFQNDPDFSQVRISSVPGWPPGTAGQEAAPLSGPGGPAGGSGGAPGGSGGPGMMGSGGGPPGGPGMMGSGGGPPGGPPAMGPGGGAGFAAPPGGSGGAAAPQIFGDLSGPAGPGLANVPSPDNGAITTGGAPIPYENAVELPKRPPSYFQFTVTGTLIKPIIRPMFGQAADTSGGAGAPYGSMMMGSGGSGGPPGAPPGFGSSGPYGSGPGPMGSGGPVATGK